ncbi:MAG: glutathione S-transferase family protein [Nannocystaceae bacterium]
MQTTPKLYAFPGSPNSRRVLAVVAHLGVDVDLQIIDLSKGQSRTPEYLEINPMGRTPTLVDGDFVLWESNAIIQYLTDRAREAGHAEAATLLPTDARGRADVTRWQAWQMSHLGAAVQTIVYENLVKRMFMGQEPDAVEVERGLRNYHPNAKFLDAHLNGRSWITGEHLTLADFAIAAVLMYAPMAGVPLEEYPNIRAWMGRMNELPAWKKSEPRMR